MTKHNLPVCLEKDKECQSFYVCKMLRERFGVSKCDKDIVDKGQDKSRIEIAHDEEIKKRIEIEKNTWSEKKDMDELNNYYNNIKSARNFLSNVVKNLNAILHDNAKYLETILNSFNNSEKIRTLKKNAQVMKETLDRLEGMDNE